MYWKKLTAEDGQVLWLFTEQPNEQHPVLLLTNASATSFAREVLGVTEPDAASDRPLLDQADQAADGEDP